MNEPRPPISTLSPQLEVRKLEVAASPMLDLIELRYQEPDGTVASGFLESGQARELAARLLEGSDQLERYAGAGGVEVRAPRGGEEPGVP